MSTRLHTYFRSSCSYRVRIALHHKRITFESKFVNLLKKENATEAHRALNAMGAIPVLEIDGLVLTQSLAILEYLEETRQERPLLPQGAAERARCRAIAHNLAVDTQPVQNLPVLLHIERLGGDKAAWAKQYIARGLAATEAMLADNARFCIGDALTLADACLMPQLYNATRFGIQLADYPRVASVFHHLITLDAVREAHPHMQEDCPSELRNQIE